jgi:hypothetical protein
MFHVRSRSNFRYLRKSFLIALLCDVILDGYLFVLNVKITALTLEIFLQNHGQLTPRIATTVLGYQDIWASRSQH